MQRIDENTFIDDSLVTCAEYQLFIDEMRAQGKFYQPDHWTSYQFPNGQAREPILGIRQSDASAFCEWLTKREGGEWKFLLPTQKEVDAFHLNIHAKGPLGYWIVEDNKFNWVSTFSKNTRTIPLDFNNVRELADPGLARALAHSLNLALNPASDRARDAVRSQTLDIAIDVARDIALGLAHTLSRTPTIDIAHALDLERVRGLARSLDLERHHFIARDHDLERDFECALDIYIALFTLQERIAGRSPAFEGIRLVKERTR